MKLSCCAIAVWIGSGCSLLLAGTCPEMSGAGRQVCIDRKQAVSPLPLELAPDELLVIDVFNKSPWEKVTFDNKFELVEDDLKKQLETLFKFLAKIVILPGPPGAPKRSINLPETERAPCPPVPISMAVPAGLSEPFQSAFANLRSALEVERGALVDRGCRATELGKSTKLILSQDPDPGTFGTDLTTLDERIAAYLDLDPVTLAASEALLQRANELAASPAYFSLLPATQQDINAALSKAVIDRTGNSQRFSDLTDKESALAAAHGLFARVAQERAEWFVAHKEYRAGRNQKATIEIASKNRADSNAETAKLATVAATWKAPTPLSMSLGFGFSGLAKKEYTVQTVRGSGALTADGTLTYKLQETRTRPVVFPLALIHFRLSPATQTAWGIALTGGAGVDASGDSPTGEIVTGLSFRLGALYISPLAHFGRRKELETGYTVGESAPKDFAPPTRSIWGAAFCLSFTYRLPF